MSEPLHSKLLKSEALRLGFSVCGIAPALPVDTREAEAYRQWIANGKQGNMHYLENYTDKRLNPALLMEGVQSVICVALSYTPPRRLPEGELQLAQYAYGKDYHDVMKWKLKELEMWMQNTMPDIQTRTFCDTAPILEKYWAWKAGLGWIGKHTQLIVPHSGSQFFLGEIFTTAPADQYDTPLENHCGNCTRCIDACPNKALEAPYRLNAERCLSYLTIENRGEINPSEGLKMGNCFYGCDACQNACPWNRFAQPTLIHEFEASSQLLAMQREDWLNLTEEKYRELFKGSAVKRAKFSGIKRNLEAIRQAEQKRDAAHKKEQKPRNVN